MVNKSVDFNRLTTKLVSPDVSDDETVGLLGGVGRGRGMSLKGRGLSVMKSRGAGRVAVPRGGCFSGGVSAAGGAHGAAGGAYGRERYEDAADQDCYGVGGDGHVAGGGYVAAGGDGHVAGGGYVAAGGDGHVAGRGYVAAGGDGHVAGGGYVAAGGDGHVAGGGYIAAGGDGHVAGGDGAYGGAGDGGFLGMMNDASENGLHHYRKYGRPVPTTEQSIQGEMTCRIGLDTC